MTRDCRRAVRMGIVAGVSLVGLCAAGALFAPAEAPLFVGAGMVTFVLCGARALKLCGADQIVFSDRPRRGPLDEEALGRSSVYLFAGVRPRASSPDSAPAEFRPAGRPLLTDDHPQRGAP